MQDQATISLVQALAPKAGIHSMRLHIPSHTADTCSVDLSLLYSDPSDVRIQLRLLASFYALSIRLRRTMLLEGCEPNL